MPLIAGIDIGNATTEVALASDDPQARAFVASGIVATTGMKGTRDNIAGTLAALEQALAPYRQAPYRWSEVKPSLEDVFIQLMSCETESVQEGHDA